MRELLIYTILAFIMTQCPLEEHRFTATVAPSGSGTVQPDTAYYRDRVMIEIDATPEQGWEFAGWSGDTTASDNPLVITITEQTSLIANFQRPEEPAQAFTEDLVVTDGRNRTSLFWGMKEGATNGFENSADIEAPPAPPRGSFYSYFKIEGHNLRGDMRPVTREKVVWELAFHAQEGRGPVSLRWDFTNTQHIGTLTLTDDLGNPGIEIDMKSVTSYDAGDSVNTLYIISN